MFHGKSKPEWSWSTIGEGADVGYVHAERCQRHDWRWWRIVHAACARPQCQPACDQLIVMHIFGISLLVCCCSILDPASSPESRTQILITPHVIVIVALKRSMDVPHWSLQVGKSLSTVTSSHCTQYTGIARYCTQYTGITRHLNMNIKMLLWWSTSLGHREHWPTKCSHTY